MFTLFDSRRGWIWFRLVWEFPATGGILTSHSFRTVKLIRYQTPIELYIVFPSEIIFIVFTVYYLIQELLEMYHVGFPDYLFDLWSWLDVTILIVRKSLFTAILIQSIFK